MRGAGGLQSQGEPLSDEKNQPVRGELKPLYRAQIVASFEKNIGPFAAPISSFKRKIGVIAAPVASSRKNISVAVESIAAAFSTRASGTSQYISALTPRSAEHLSCRC